MNRRHLSRKTGSLFARLRLVVWAAIFLQAACFSGCTMWNSSGESGLSRLLPHTNSSEFPSQSEPPIEEDDVHADGSPVTAAGQE